MTCLLERSRTFWLEAMRPVDPELPSHRAPEPRSFDHWLQELGLVCEGPHPGTGALLLTHDDLTNLTGKYRLLKRNEGALYGWWRQCPDRGEPRTVREWLDDFSWEIVEPTESDTDDLDLFLGHDEFWRWSSGKVEDDGS